MIVNKKTVQSILIVLFVLIVHTLVYSKNIKYSSNEELIQKIKTMKMATDFELTASIDELDTISFGNYSQSKDDYGIYTKEPIEWILVYKDDTNALLMSRYILDCKPYNNLEPDFKGSVHIFDNNDKHLASDWEYSTLRKWMNDEMYNDMFNDDEKKLLNTSYLDNIYIYGKDNSSSGNYTKDHVFILNEEEIEHFLGKSNKLKATKGTDYAVKLKGLSAVYSKDEWNNGNSGYFLRSRGIFSTVNAITNEGKFKRKIPIDSQYYGIRPCIFVKLKDTNDLARIDLDTEVRNDKVENDDSISFETVKFGIWTDQKRTVDLEWYVLKKENGKALLFSKNVITKKKWYDKKTSDIQWETSNVRKYLNEDFYNLVFTDKEKGIIQSTNVKYSNNPASSKIIEKYTLDKIFILSYDEVRDLIGLDNKKILMGLDFREKNAIYDLRTPGTKENCVCTINLGRVNTKGSEAQFERYIRPAMWVTMD